MPWATLLGDRLELHASAIPPVFSKRFCATPCCSGRVVTLSVPPRDVPKSNDASTCSCSMQQQGITQAEVDRAVADDTAVNLRRIEAVSLRLSKLGADPKPSIVIVESVPATDVEKLRNWGSLLLRAACV